MPQASVTLSFRDTRRGEKALPGMTSEQARKHLEAAEKNLRTAVDQLIIQPSKAARLEASLKTIAETIQKVSSERSSFAQSPSIAQLLSRIRAHVARMQLLLDTAATFYCGAMADALSNTGAYTSDGQLPRHIQSGCLKLEA